MSTDKTPGLSPWRRFRLVLTGVLILLLFGLAAIWRLGTMDASLDQWVDPPKDGRPAFIATAYPRLGLPINPTLKQRFDYSYRNFKFA